MHRPAGHDFPAGGCWSEPLSNANLIILLSTVSTGLILGAVFSLVAVGVTIVYGSIWMPNAANGQFFVLAALLGWTMTVTWGIPPAIAALLVIGASVPLSYALEWALIKRFYDVPNRNISYFVLSLGITQILTGVFTLTYARWADQFQLPPLVKGITFIGPFPMANNRLAVLAIAILILIGLFALLRFHRYGRALRAVFQNRDAAALRGVNVKASYRLSFALGNAVIFAGGMLFALAYSFDLTAAWSMSITAFAIMIIGGPGSVLGALIVGMVFGFTQAAVSAVASPTIAAFAYLGAMLLILLFKPSGLFAR
jgi:branched-subunit amino acid ABC-type transport system permease component